MHKLCPFCGGQPNIITFEEKEDRCTFHGYAQIECSCCGARSSKILLYTDWDNGYDCERTKTAALKEDAWKTWDKS